MAQFARPTATTTIGGFETEAAGVTNIHLQIDETSANDADYIISDPTLTTDIYVTALGTVEDPLSSSGHVVRYRYAKSAAGGATVGLLVELREGYVSEGTPGTLIASATHADISETITAGTFTLSAGEANSITDYSDLSLRFVVTQS